MIKAGKYFVFGFLFLFIIPLLLEAKAATDGVWANWSNSTSCRASVCGTNNGTLNQSRSCVYDVGENECGSYPQNGQTMTPTCDERYTFQSHADNADETCTLGRRSTEADCSQRYKLIKVSSTWRCVMWVASSSQTRSVSCSNATITPCPPTPTQTEVVCHRNDRDDEGDDCEQRSFTNNCARGWHPGACPGEVTPSPEPSITPEPTAAPTGGESTPTPTVLPTEAPSETKSSSNTSYSDPGPASPPTCNDANPGAVSNLRVYALGGGKVKLTWEAVSGPVSSYAVAYGPSKDDFKYGDPNVGKVTSYIVSALNPGGNYCFYVQAQNGCMPGGQSNVVCTNQGAGSLQVLGAFDNYNPLVDGIRASFGGIALGTSGELAGTAEVVYSADKLPSGNTIDENHSLSIPSLELNQNVYLPQTLGDQLVVGQHEVLYTKLNGVDFYYGHNGNDVFGRLWKVAKGDVLEVTTMGKTIKYQVDSSQFVNKTEVDAVKADTRTQIVLMTCSYTAPDFRLIVKASLIK